MNTALDVMISPELDPELAAMPIRPLNELPPSPWRSLGRYLDYSNWPDRDRFLELDRAIQLYAQPDEVEESPVVAVQQLTPREEHWAVAPFSNAA